MTIQPPWVIANLADRTLGIASDETLAIAVAIALAESGGNDQIVSPVNPDGSRDTGLWQINSVHQRDHPSWTIDYLKNPQHNADAMVAVSNHGTNWRPWTTYKNGTYKSFLDQGRKAVQEMHDQPGRSIGDIISKGIETGTDLGYGGPIASTATTTVEALKDIATAALSVSEAIGKAGAWLADSNNWIRVAQIAGGITLGLIAVTVVAKPVLDQAKGFV